MPDTTHYSQTGEVDASLPEPAFTLSPNPVAQGSGQLPMLAVDPQLLRFSPLLTLCDIAGRELFRTTLRQAVTLLPPTLPTGTCFVTLTTLQGSATRRLVVE